MANEIQVFNFNGSETRVVEVNGQPWWVTKDVCEILGLDVASGARGLDDDEKGLHIMQTHGGDQQVSIISEAGLYSLILRSRKPEAKAFKRWVTHEVLPSIRKHGLYAAPATVDDILGNPDAFIRILQQIKEERAKNAELSAEREKNAPKVLFADSVAASHTDILIGDLAKLLRQNGVEIGQKRLFDWLRENGWLMKQKGTSWNMPTQRAMEMGLFRVKETTINKPDGSVQISKTTKVTGKGQIFFVNKFLEAEADTEAKSA